MTRRVLLAVIAGAIAVLATPAPASAHAALARTNPTASAVLPSAPAEIVLTFTESVQRVPGRIRVIGPDGRRADRGEPSFAGAVVRIPIGQDLGNGTYLVSFRVISADSHPIAGGYTYSVGAPSTAPTLEEGTGTSAVVANAIKVVRYLGYAGLALLIGPVLVLSLLWPARLSRRGPSIVIWVGMGLVAFATLAEMWFQAPYTTGGGPFDGGGLRNVLFSTFGTAHLIRLGSLIAITLLLPPLLRGRLGRIGQILLLVLGVGALLTWPVTGHPAASPVVAVSFVVDTVHLASMATWLGGLFMLVVFLLRDANERELGAILPIWSRLATLAVSALVLAGTAQALIEVNTLKALVSTSYGKMIIAKIVLFGVVIAVGAYPRYLVRKRLANSRPRWLRRAVGVELSIVAVVLALSATLVQTTPARTAANSGDQTTVGSYSQILTGNIFNLQVDINPAQIGNNTIHLFAYDKANKPLPVVEWKGVAALPARDLAPVGFPLPRLTDNQSSGEITFPFAGDWELRFTIRISEIDQETVTATVPVS